MKRIISVFKKPIAFILALVLLASTLFCLSLINIPTLADENIKVITKTFDIYNTGVLGASKYTYQSNATRLNIKDNRSYPELGPVGTYYAACYVNPTVNDGPIIAIWSDTENGIETFKMTAVCKPASNMTLEEFLFDAYRFSASADGVTYTDLTYTYSENTTSGYQLGERGSGYKFYDLIMSQLPQGTKHVKFTSGVTGSMCTGSACWQRCFNFVEYTYSINLADKTAPIIEPMFADASGGFSCPVIDGATAPNKVQLFIDSIEPELEGKYSVKKDGTDYTVPSDMILTEDGEYTVSAENILGSSNISFTIDSSKAVTGIEKYYDFSGGKISAQAAFTSLKSFGDVAVNDGSNVIVCDTQANATNKPWWGLRDGGTKLTTGSDAKGYKHTGYFCFQNVDEDGNKYSGINITYTVARASGYSVDAQLKVYSLDAASGSWNEIPQSGVTETLLSGNPAAKQCNATYAIGEAGSTVKIEFNTPTTYAAWMAGFLSVLDITKITVPSIKVSEDGVGISKGDVVMDEVLIEVADSDYWFIEKDGVIIDKPANNIVSQTGKYKVTACSYMGCSTFEFEINPNGGLNPDDLIKTVVKKYDIYNTGELGTTDFTNQSNQTKLSVKNSAVISYPKLTPDGKYYVGMYVNYVDNDGPVTATWSDTKNGMETFKMTALCAPDKNMTLEEFFKDAYRLSASSDGTNFTDVDFTFAENNISGYGLGEHGSGYKYYDLVISALPAGTKYVKFTSGVTGEQSKGGDCWRRSFAAVEYSYTLDLTSATPPNISAYFADSSGNFTAPVIDGVTVPSKVKVSADGMESVLKGKISVKKDGETCILPADMVFTEDGVYTVKAKNIIGITTLTFTIDSSKAVESGLYYDFSRDLEKAKKNFEKLTSIGNHGLNGKDSHIIVCDTQVKATNKPWWGLREGGTKLTTGSDSRGYEQTGYFVFENIDEKGNKYTGFNMTYTVARQSGYPTDASINVYILNKKTNKWMLIEPVSTTKNALGTDPLVWQCNSTYVLGEEGSIVKVEFITPDGYEKWKSGALSVLDVKKLSLPLIIGKTNGKQFLNNSVVQSDVKLEVKNEDYWFIEKDGETIKTPKNNTFKEDGLYTAYACSYTGTAVFNFYIARKIPVAVLYDVNGNFIKNGDTVVDDVRIVTYNAEKLKITKDGKAYKATNNILEKNGVYVITVSKKGFEDSVIKVTINRNTPNLKVLDFRSKEVKNGDVIETEATYSYNTFDTKNNIKITLNGKTHKPEKEGTLTKEGKYVITVTNAAGKASLSFTIKYNPPLPDYKHPGEIVTILDYENDAKWGDYIYLKQSMQRDNTTAIKSGWTGLKGPVIHPSGIDFETDPYVIYKNGAFDSFVLWGLYLPQEGFDVNNIYTIEASKDGKKYTKLSFTNEHDISHITIVRGYVKYRLVAQNIPEGTKYIKVSINTKDADAGWSRMYTKVEFSCNKEDMNNLDVDDIIFMMSDAEYGDTREVTLYRSRNNIIPKKVFEAFRDEDKTLKVNIVDDNDNLLYTLSFNGLDIIEPMDFHTGVNFTTAPKHFTKEDPYALSISFEQKGDWTMSLTLGMSGMKDWSGGMRYNLYTVEDGAYIISDFCVATWNQIEFRIENNGTYILSTNKKLETEPEEPSDTEDGKEDGKPNDEESDQKPSDDKEENSSDYQDGNDENTSEDQESTYEDDGSGDEEDVKEDEEIKPDTEIEEEEVKKKGQYIMVRTRKKWIPFDGGMDTWLIVVICVASALVLGGCVTVTLLILKRKNIIFKGRVKK